MQKVVYSFEELPAEASGLAGGKGWSLEKLHRAGCPVPEGFIVAAGAFAGDCLLPEAWDQARERLAELRAGEGERAFAVRSSALSEDSEQASFAGEFETRLNLSGEEEIRQAIQQVYRSRRGERVRAYSRARGVDEAQEVAVVVQRMVAAERSGVLFTANPTNGLRSQVMINAAWGLGEAIVSGAVTPDTIVVDQERQRVIARRTATKEVMTAPRAGGIEERRLEGKRRKQAVLGDAEAVALANLGARIEALYGMPMDIEWAASGGRFFVLQARPITALPDPPPPAHWKLPRGAYAAMRVNIIELMAEPLSPLFETLGLEVVNASMRAMMTAFLGANIMPEGPIISVNHYAYYNGSLKPRNIARLLLDSPGIARRMLAAPVERWTEQGRPQYRSAVERWKAASWRERSSAEILQAARELLHAALDAYWSMVGGVLPAAWISEALFTGFYRLLVRRRGEPQAFAFLLGFESEPIRSDRSLYALARWARGREALARYLAETPAQRLAQDLRLAEPPEQSLQADWAGWRENVQAHLERYGHSLYDLDFANPVPVRDPAPILETCRLYLGGKGIDPHERQQAAAERREAALAAVRKRLKGWRSKAFERLLAQAQRFAPLREDALADLGLAYPLLQQMLCVLGERLARAGAIDRPEELYWLTGEEAATACARLDGGLPLERMARAISERKAIRRSVQKATPPARLPHLSLPGLPALFERLSRGGQGRALHGVGAATGRVTAAASLLRGPQDFERMAAGSVLVARLTTPAWTPLFVRAAAIVTDVGGPLSHGSIVAREYGIPAVLGTGDATRRIRHGQMLTVDGDAGLVLLGEDGGTGQESE